MNQELFEVYFDAMFNDGEDDPSVLMWVSRGLDIDLLQLHHAAMNGNAQDVHNLIVSGSDVNASLMDGVTPLHVATFAGNHVVINRLARAHGVNVNAGDINGSTPLHYAAMLNAGDVATTLSMMQGRCLHTWQRPAMRSMSRCPEEVSLRPPLTPGAFSRMPISSMALKMWRIRPPGNI